MSNAIYLKVDGAPGTSVAKGHDKEIELESYSFGGSQLSNQAYGGGAGAGKVSFQDFHFTAKVGEESPNMFLFMCSGKHIDKVVLSAEKAGGDASVKFIEITLEDCFMTSFSMADSSGGPDPSGSYSLNFSKAKFKYTGQSDKGANAAGKETGWDAKKNQKY
jgi:type VI secretion system secreted protein Hcp